MEMKEKIKKKIGKGVEFLKNELQDRLTIIIFIVTVLVLSSEVWLCYLLGIIFNSAYLIGIATTCWLFWLSPFTPFLSISFLLTIGIREGIRKIQERGKKK